MPQILKYKGIEHWTGGVQGIVIVKPDAPFGLPLSPDKWLYLFALAVAVVMFVLGVGNLLRGRVGRALIAIRDHPIAAEAMGIEHGAATSRSPSASARSIPASAGALERASRSSSSRRTASASFSRSRFWSASWSAGWPRSPARSSARLFIQFIPNVADQLSKSAPWAVYGVFLIAFMYFMPTGVAGALQMIWARFCRTR